MSSTDGQMFANQDRTSGLRTELPLVSVLVPVFRPQESHLRQAIESVLGQTYANFELLLLDDCPDSPSGAIVRSYADPRIRYAANERNLGISESRNRLIAMARGEYLALLDHDDICLPTRLEKQVAYMQEHPEAGVVSSQLRYIPKQTVSSYPEEDLGIKMALMFGCALPHTAAMIRRSVLDKSSVRYEKEYSPAEDYRLWARLFPLTTFHNMQEALVEYRLHKGNTTLQTRGKMQTAHWEIAMRLRVEQPQYYQAALIKAKSSIRIRLFGLPLLKIVTRHGKTIVYLFAVLPVLSLKKKLTI